jgi:hypothetical protein
VAAPPVSSADPPDVSDLVDPTAEPDRSRRRRLIGPTAAVIMCVLIIGMWVVVYWWGAVQKPADKLDNSTFGQQAEPICRTTTAQLNALPKAFQTPTNTGRAAVVAQTNDDLREMLTRLAAIAPTTGTDGRIVHEWLHDYSTYVGNREDYVRRLRTDPDARFYESQKDPGEQITDPVDSFATANGMNDCVAPEDLS